MLTHLSIRNYTLVDRLELELSRGMTAITGETGAGKSIMLDALGQAMGDRADGDRVRTGQERADISATFDISNIPAACQWLREHDLEASECILRRVITREGRSRGYINGQPVTLQQLRTLGEMLIDIHSQHEHQSLLKKDTHRRLLDEFAGQTDLAQQVRNEYRQWQKAQERFCNLRDNAEEVNARFQLLSYQVNELEQLNLEDGEVVQLEAEQKTLANADSILRNSHCAVALCEDESGNGLLDGIAQALSLLTDLPEKTAALKEAEQLFASAQIQIEEAKRELEHHIDSFELDPARLQEVEERLSSIYQVARRHRVQPDELFHIHANLNEELSQLQGGDEALEQLEQEAEKLQQLFLQQAKKLTAARKKAAEKLSREVNEQLNDLAMADAQLSIMLNPIDKGSTHGLEDIEFLISTNPGQPPKPLAKIASGGELSRISLAIQVITAKTSAIPTLVFDEVDVGIGGATGNVVGSLLRSLGDNGQVLCVTHLAQVASQAHQHLQVAKRRDEQSAETELINLNDEDKVVEIARMLGGASVTDQSIAHAREMISHH